MPRTGRGVNGLKRTETTLSIFVGRDECLVEGGDANPMKSWRNLENYGYECPRAQYVQHPLQQNLTQMGRDWGVSQKTLIGWKNAQRWDLLRKNHWERIWQDEAGSEAKSLAKTQKSEIIGRISDWKNQRESIKAELRLNTVESISPTGKKIERRLDPSERASLAKTLALIDAQLDKCYGMVGMVKEEIQGAQSKLQANGVIINISAPLQASEPIPVLSGPSPGVTVYEALPMLEPVEKPDCPVFEE